MVGVAKLDGINKSDADLAPLVAAAEALVPPATSCAASVVASCGAGAAS